MGNSSNEFMCLDSPDSGVWEYVKLVKNVEIEEDI